MPATVDELLQKRGVGWLCATPWAIRRCDHGVPLVSGYRWDTGVQVHGGSAAPARRVTASVTQRDAVEPPLKDDNTGKNVAGRVDASAAQRRDWSSARPAARGAFVSDHAVTGPSRAAAMTTAAA